MQAIAFDPLLPLPLIAALAALARDRGGAGALARADRLVAARARGAGAARGAGRAVAAARGPRAGGEHRHRGARRQRQQPHRRARRAARRGARGAARRGSTGWARAAGSRCTPCTSPTAARTAPQLLTALAEATAELPADRIAGAILVTDGQVHDPEALDELPGAGAGAADRQRRGLGPARGGRDRARLRHRRRGGEPGAAGRGPGRRARRAASRRSRSRSTAPSRMRFDVPLNRSVTLPVTLQRGGVNVLQIATPEVAGELTGRNNQADRLDQRRARPAAGAAGLRRALSRRAHLAEPAEVRQRGRPRALHHPAPAGEAGLRAGLRALADRLPDPGAVHGEGRRVRPDHLRPLQAPRHPAQPPTSRTSPATCATAGRC